MSEGIDHDSSRTPIGDRIETLLEALDIGSAHIGTSVPMELVSLITGNPDAISSLTLLNASRFPLEALATLASRMIVFSGDKGLAGEATRHAKASFLESEIIEFPNYPAMIWTDMAADHTEQITNSLLDFLIRQEDLKPATIISSDGRSGEAGGITYRISGEGPALLLFPAMIAASQWNPLVDRLAQHFSVLRLGGKHLGAVSIFEGRGSDPSYHRLGLNLLRDARIEACDQLLEIGCGSGVTSRWLVGNNLCAKPLTAVDLNPFLLDEARNLAETEGLGGTIEFCQGDAENLSFPNDSFGNVISFTLVEECDADKALREMVRVTKPGGRVAAVVRACDMPVFWNLPLDAKIKSKVQAPIVQVAPRGCADASISRRLRDAGLKDVIAYPSFYGGKAMEEYYEPVALSHLDDDEIFLWNEAKATALADGSFYMMHPVHCAIGTKPQLA